MVDKKNILICPLDWGLGHACRCVPVIHAFIAAGANVIIAADHRPLAFLRKEFPDLQCIKFPAYQVTYQRKGSFALKFFSMIPQILLSIYREHKLLDRLIEDYHIDLVFSDNRFGLWNKKAKSIFMTHQVMIKSPLKSEFFDKILFGFNKAFIRNYDECWIPDFEGAINLTGDLAHKYSLPVPTYFIGPLSRFQHKADVAEAQGPELLVLLSGPEPQRTIFEEIILKQLEHKCIQTIIVQGIPEKETVIKINDHTTIFSHLETDKLQKVLLQSDRVLCRSGYSTIMDLVVFGKKAILVPTPGQTEQEYLGRYYLEKNYFYTVSQKLFRLDKAVLESEHFTGIRMETKGNVLKERVGEGIRDGIPNERQAGQSSAKLININE